MSGHEDWCTAVGTDDDGVHHSCGRVSGHRVPHQCRGSRCTHQWGEAQVVSVGAMTVNLTVSGEMLRLMADDLVDGVPSPHPGMQPNDYIEAMVLHRLASTLRRVAGTAEKT